MIETATAGLVLVPLDPGHAPAVHALIAKNRGHLTAHGDYADLVALTVAALAAELDRPDGRGLRFGIVHHDELIGRIDLVPVAPPRYGLGYWLAQSATGRGHATAALRALLDFATTTLAATDVFAGVTHGNARSAALLQRTGFTRVETFDTYARYHLALR